MKIPNTPLVEEVAYFIGRFNGKGQNKEVMHVFTNGCCFWFAQILADRFCLYSEIKYDPVEGHFYTTVAGRDYDITGDVTGKYKGVPWDEYYCDINLRKIIIRDCILFEELKE